MPNPQFRPLVVDPILAKQIHLEEDKFAIAERAALDLILEEIKRVLSRDGE